MTFGAIMFVDRIGRRQLLLIGSVGMFIGLVMACIAFTQQIGSGDDITLPDDWGVVALIGANLFVVAFAATWGPVMWVMLGEMFPNRIRGVALGVCTGVNWLANFTISLLFPELNSVLGLAWIYGFFAFCAFISWFYVHYKVPETKGMELEDMDSLGEVEAVSSSRRRRLAPPGEVAGRLSHPAAWARRLTLSMPSRSNIWATKYDERTQRPR